jgi:acetolactate synthase-1/2/3 large subunit
MNIQEMATCYCEKVPVKVMLLNNQHLGMVAQLEDHFCASNRAQTYLGPIDRPEAIGRAGGDGPSQRYPDFVAIARGYGWQARHVAESSQLVDAMEEMIAAEGPFLLDIAVPQEQHVLPMIPAGMGVRELIKR